MTASADVASDDGNRARKEARDGQHGVGRSVTLGPAAAALIILGGLSTGAAVTAILAWPTESQTPALQPVAQAEIDAAAPSLFGPTMVATIEAAKSCRRPLAFVTIESSGDVFGKLRIRSGDYLSPIVQIGRQPFRLALPFPALVSSGHGQITVASDSGGAVVFLSPGVVIPPGKHERVVNVTWDPKIVCTAAQ